MLSVPFQKVASQFQSLGIPCQMSLPVQQVFLAHGVSWKVQPQRVSFSSCSKTRQKAKAEEENWWVGACRCYHSYLVCFLYNVSCFVWKKISSVVLYKFLKYLQVYLQVISIPVTGNFNTCLTGIPAGTCDLQVFDLQVTGTCWQVFWQVQVWVLESKLPAGQVQVDLQVHLWAALEEITTLWITRCTPWPAQSSQN